MRICRGRTLRGLTATAVSSALFTLAACGSDSGLTVGAAGALQDRVDAVRASAAAGDREAAQAALNVFRAEVHRLVGTGALDPADAVTLLAQADRVGEDVDAEVRAPAASVARPVTTTAAGGADFSRALAALIRERMQDRADKRDDEKRDQDKRAEDTREDRERDREDGDGDDD